MTDWSGFMAFDRQLVKSKIESLQLTSIERAQVSSLLEHRYRGVFDRRQVESHISNQIEGGFAEFAAELLSQVLVPGDRLLDVGSGFGTFVLLTRLLGYESIGIEIDPFDSDFAKARCSTLDVNADPSSVFLEGDFLNFDQEVGSFRAITMWNVAEHVPSVEKLLTKAYDLLANPGYLFLICPNYAAEREEAHYHIPWDSRLLQDECGLREHIESFGKDASFFFSHVSPRTNREICDVATKVGFGLAPIYQSSRNPASPPRKLFSIRNFRAYRELTAEKRHSVELLLIKENR
jgi:MPBQ/MSBQ methyltransferase